MKDNMKNVSLPPQDKTISDFWKMSQKMNCDDFIKMVKEVKIKIIYSDE
jgi:hypothetical protein